MKIVVTVEVEPLELWHAARVHLNARGEFGLEELRNTLGKPGAPYLEACFKELLSEVATLEVKHAMIEQAPAPEPPKSPVHKFEKHQQAWLHGNKLVRIADYETSATTCLINYKTAKGWSKSRYIADKATLTPITEEPADV